MSKKLIRIPPSKISTNNDFVIGKDISIVFASGASLFGVIQKIEKDIVFFKDKRFTKHKIALSNIQELIIDQYTDD